MAITSIGYDGQVDEGKVPKWARALGGLDYGVRDEASWKVTPVPSSARTVQVAKGAGWGRGITDESDEAVQIPIPNPSSGTLYHAIVARRNITGSGGTTSFGYTPGATDPWGAIAGRQTFETGSGSIDEQPLAIARVTRDNPTVQVTPVRCWQANGGAAGESDYVRGYLDRIGTMITMPSGITWQRIVDPEGTPAWLAKQPEPVQRRWHDVDLRTRTWGPNATGNMAGRLISGAPAGEYLITALAQVRRTPGAGVGPMFSSFLIDGQSVAELENTARDAWYLEQRTLLEVRPTAGSFQVVYRLRTTNAQCTVKTASLSVAYLGPTA